MSEEIHYIDEIATQLTLDSALSEILHLQGQLTARDQQLLECKRKGAEWARRALAAEAKVAEYEATLTQKERLLVDIGKQLQDVQAERAKLKWHDDLGKVSYKRCSTPEKKILEALVAIRSETPIAPDGYFKAPTKEIAKRAGMAERTVKNHLPDMEDKGFIAREGHSLKVDDGILNNPFHINRLVPVELPEKRGGLREKNQEV